MVAGLDAGLRDCGSSQPAPPEAHGEIATQRDILYSAYHKALEQIEPADSAQGRTFRPASAYSGGSDAEKIGFSRLAIDDAL